MHLISHGETRTSCVSLEECPFPAQPHLCVTVLDRLSATRQYGIGGIRATVSRPHSGGQTQRYVPQTFRSSRQLLPTSRSNSGSLYPETSAYETTVQHHRERSSSPIPRHEIQSQRSYDHSKVTSKGNPSPHGTGWWHTTTHHR